MTQTEAGHVTGTIRARTMSDSLSAMFDRLRDAAEAHDASAPVDPGDAGDRAAAQRPRARASCLLFMVDRPLIPRLRASE
jgi:hypothetical protein